MARLVAKTPEIPDLRERIAVGRELGKKATETAGRAHRYLYAALQHCTESYIRIASSAELKDEFLEMCNENSIKRTAASKPLAMLLKLVLGLDNKAASVYALAIGFALDRKISPRKIARFFGKSTGGIQGCVARARKAMKEQTGTQSGAKASITAPKTTWTSRARDGLKASADLEKIVLFATVENGGALRITRVLKPSRAMRKLRTQLAQGYSADQTAA